MAVPTFKKRSFRNFLINPHLQRQYALYVTGLMLFFAILIGFTVWLTVKGVLVAEYSPLGQERHLVVFDEIYKQLTVRVSILFAAAVIITYITSIWFMHRVAGPIYRTHQVLKQIIKGEIPPRMVEFRKNDYFKEILPDLNRVVEIVRKQKQK